MKVLLDTHVAIWAVSDTKKLTKEIRDIVADARNEVCVSAISVLEIAIKYAGGRRDAPPFSAAVAMGYFHLLLDLTAEHALGVERLPPIMAMRLTGFSWHKPWRNRSG